MPIKKRIPKNIVIQSEGFAETLCCRKLMHYILCIEIKKIRVNFHEDRLGVSTIIPRLE